jgi:MoxR-like ATPase
MFKVLVPYSPPAVEVEILRRNHRGFDPHNIESSGINKVIDAQQVVEIRKQIQHVTVEDGILDYIASINAASRRSPDLVLGASARAATHVLAASKTLAAMQGRDFVTPDDVKYIVPPVFRHRILLKPEAEIEGLDADAVIQRLLGQVEVPR